MILIDCLVVASVIVLTTLTSGWLVARATGSLKQEPARPALLDEKGASLEVQDETPPGSAEPEGEPLSAASSESAADLDTGRIVGKCENVLIILFVVAGAITGMALIFTAKAFVRQKEFQGNPRYYLVGTLVNTTYSVTMGFVAHVILQAIHGGRLFA